MKTIFTLFFTLFISTISIAQNLSGRDVIQKVQNNYQTIIDASAEFTQQGIFKQGIGQKVKGIIEIKKGDKLRLTTDEQIMVTDGKISWTHSLVTGKCIIDHYIPEEAELSVSKFFLEFPKDFYISVGGRDKINQLNVYELKLAPKSTDNVIKQMRLWVDEKEWIVRKIEMEDRNNSTTIYELTKILINNNLADSRFIYQVPAGVEIIDLR